MTMLKFKLTSVPHRNGGAVTDWGVFTSVRDATMAARAIKKALPDRELHFSAVGTGQSSFDTRILMQPDEYTPDVEIVLSDGRIVWLGDVDHALRAHLDAR